MYQIQPNGWIKRVPDDGVELSFPPDPVNMDYQRYLTWVTEGNVPDQAPIPTPVVPQVVSRFQARAALLQAGLLDQVEALISNANTPAITRLAWTDAQEFLRNSPTILSVAGTLGLTNEEIDALFVAASGITA